MGVQLFISNYLLVERQNYSVFVVEAQNPAYRV